MRHFFPAALVALALLAPLRPAAAALMSVNPASIGDLSPEITFSQVAAGPYAGLGFAVGTNQTVEFSSYFLGQTPTGTNPVTLAQPSAPGQALQLVYSANDYIQVVQDAAAGAQVLAGGPVTFRQPISILFQGPVAAVTLTAGYLDAVGTLTIAAYSAAGAALGSVTNTATGFEQFGLTDPGGPPIAGLSITSTDPGGFALDNLAVPIPEPAMLGPLALGAAALGLALHRRRLRTAAD